MLTPLKAEILGLDDPSHDARRFRTVLRMFERNLELLLEGTGLAAAIDHTALARAFSNWRQAFDKSKYLADINRNDFIVYASGLMLKELIEAKPVAISATGEARAADARPVDERLLRWPEGYAYTSFCLAFTESIIGQFGAELPAESRAAGEAAFWDTFRENTRDNSSTAIAFFDFICGQEPNWDAPDVPFLRPALRAHVNRGLAAPGSAGRIG